ncbi:hypothetical protein U1Q18_045340 [Sarracenia purpurea var. burkii]
MNCHRRRAKAPQAVVLLLTVVAAGLAVGGKGQTTCGSTFFSALVHLIPCRAAVTPFSPIPPSDSCCSAIRTLGQPCLCVLVNGPPITGVNRNMAMQLPDKCSANFEPSGHYALGFRTGRRMKAGLLVFMLTEVGFKEDPWDAS